jgi:hypothetical protein
MTTTSDQDGGTPVDPQRPGTDEHPTVVMTAYGAMPAYSADDVLPTRPVGGHRRGGSAGQDGWSQARTTPTPLGRVVLPAILALVSGVGLFAAWSHLQDDRAAQSAVSSPVHSAVASAPAPAPSSTPTVAAPVTRSPSASPSASAAPSGTASAARTPTASASSTPSASTSASAAAVVDRSVPVVVLNATGRTGLAASVAARLRREGWKVVSVGNYRHGGITATTVFAAGHADAVRTIRGDLPTRDAERTPTGSMNPNRITVVIGPDYPRR